jgi:cellulose synthase/poly-beta-1,6-N-acetylglucosamine synthase-like glycosyltransferase
MFLVSAVVAGALLFLSFLHFVIGLCLVSKLPRPAAATAREKKLPKAGVVLCVRGYDPVLQDCLRSLMAQDYPQYRVEVVVDSEEDPAWNAVQKVIGEAGSSHTRARVLVSRRPTCSLKCSALVQGVRGLDASHEVIAFIDSDVVPHRTWLRELVAPLADPRVGATTGNRWYAGPRRYFGSLARSAWNAAAVAQMSLFGMAWGGTMAIRRETIDKARLLEKWSRSFNDDIVLSEAVRSFGLRLHLCPALLLVRGDECPLGSVSSFVRRQLMHLRFYLRPWPVVAAFGVLSTWLPPLAVVLLLVSLGLGDGASASCCGVGIAGFLGLLILAYLSVETGVARVLRQHGRRVEALGFRVLWAVPLAVGVYAWALTSAMLNRTVSWRGVRYRIHDRWRVELLEYRPFVARPMALESLTSLTEK